MPAKNHMELLTSGATEKQTSIVRTAGQEEVNRERQAAMGTGKWALKNPGFISFLHKDI